MAPQTLYWHGNVTLDNVEAWCNEFGHMNGNWSSDRSKGTQEEDLAFSRFLIKANNAKPVFAKFSLRREKGLQAGTVHYQIWMKLLGKKRLTKGQVLNADSPLSKILKAKGHISPAAKANQESDDYLDKVETSLEGFEKIRSKEVKMPSKPRKKDVAYMFMHHQRETGNLYTWQMQMVEIIEEKLGMEMNFTNFFADPFFKREIQVLIEDKGNVGKSVFISYLEQAYWPSIMVVPGIMGSAMELVNFMCSTFAQGKRNVDDVKLVCFDLPRAVSDAMGRQKVLGFFANLEMVKNGHLFDWRFKSKEVRWTYWPGVLLTCNTLPKGFEKSMSRDRWNIGYIVENLDTLDIDYKIVDEEPEAAMDGVDNDEAAGGDIAPGAFDDA